MNRSSLPLLVSLLFVGAPALAQPVAPAPAAPPVAPAAPTAPVAPAVPATPDTAAVPATPAPAPATAATPIELSTLHLLLQKGVISQAEYDSALRDMGDSVGTAAGDQATVVTSKWAATLYGFVEADSIYDSTQSFNDLAGNQTVAQPSDPKQNNGRVQFGARNSRIGFRLKAPEVGGIRTSAVAEMDFLGNQPTIAYTTNPIGTTGTVSEAGYFTNPAFRARHLYVKMETDAVDFLFGQYWQLYGWQSVYHPASVQIQGLPGQIYSRTPQVRISKSIKSDSFLFEIAIAAMRPPQRDSAIPEGQAGIRVGFPQWSGVMTNGATGTGVQPLSLAVTGDARSVRLPNYFKNADDPFGGTQKLGTSIAVDAVIPIIPAKKRQGNALTLNGELSTGYGNADLYTGLTGGASAPMYGATAKTAAATPAPIDPGIALYDSAGNVHMIGWTSWLVGIQYTLPGLDGKYWLALNYSHLASNNLSNFVSGPAKVLDQRDFYDANLFADMGAAVRLGLEYSMFDDLYANSDIHARDNRVQFSAFYIF